MDVSPTTHRPEPDLEVDALGLLCPLPVLRLRKRIAGLAEGAEVRLLADDPAAEIDVPHFCAEAGHSYLGSSAAGEAGADRAPRAYLIRIGARG